MIWPWSEIAELRARAERAEALLQRAADDALSAAGQRPVFTPDDPRYQPRPLSEQMDEQRRVMASRQQQSPAARERESRRRAREDAQRQLSEAMRRARPLTAREEEAGTEAT